SPSAPPPKILVVWRRWPKRSNISQREPNEAGSRRALAALDLLARICAPALAAAGPDRLKRRDEKSTRSRGFSLAFAYGAFLNTTVTKSRFFILVILANAAILAAGYYYLEYWRTKPSEAVPVEAPAPVLAEVHTNRPAEAPVSNSAPVVIVQT